MSECCGRVRVLSHTHTCIHTHMQWRVLKFCSCQSSLASSRGFQSRPLYHFCTLPGTCQTGASKAAGYFRSIFAQFPIFAQQNLLLIRSARLPHDFPSLFTWVSPAASVAFPPKSLDEYEKFPTRCSLFSPCWNFRLFLGKRRRELCANNCKIIKMTGRHSKGAGEWVYRCVCECVWVH